MKLEYVDAHYCSYHSDIDLRTRIVFSSDDEINVDDIFAELLQERLTSFAHRLLDDRMSLSLFFKIFEEAEVLYYNQQSVEIPSFAYENSFHRDGSVYKYHGTNMMYETTAEIHSFVDGRHISTLSHIPKHLQLFTDTALVENLQLDPKYLRDYISLMSI